MSYQQYNQWVPMHTYNPEGWGPAPQQISYKPAAGVQEVEIDGQQPPNTPAAKKTYFTGLQNTLRLWLIGAAVVLLVNVVWLVVAKAKYGIRDGYGTIQQGDCESVKRSNIWLHFLINVLSTLLLSGSNAFMTAYSSPTRKEVDKAHARRVWLHIGFPSWRNFRGIAKRKTLVVFTLVLTSVPFHLLYNSLVYASLSANDYYWLIATEDFLSGAPFNLTVFNPYFGQAELGASNPDGTDSNDDDGSSLNNYFQSIQQNASQWNRLDQKACIQAYSSAFQNERRNVVLVTSNKNDTTSIVNYGAAELDVTSDITNNWWICSLLFNDGGNQYCNPQDYIKNAASWTVFDEPIEYCLSEKVKSTCSIRFSMDIMITVVAFNALKLLLMSWVYFRFDAKNILASVGDAAASFLQWPDPTTGGMCLASRRSIDKSWRMPNVATLYRGTRRFHWGQALTKKRWILFFLLCAVALFAVFIFGGILGFENTKAKGIGLDPASLWKLGFGVPNSATMVFSGSEGNALTMSLLANSPQVVLAGIYLMYMGIINSMFMAVDWARFASTPQTLMVSAPQGKQRGTWLLGSPLKFGIPILVIQVLLHWFVSQAIFMVEIQEYDILGHIARDSTIFSNCGYSPIAIILAVVTVSIMILVAIVLMFCRFAAGSPPVVSTCSAAISASCHVPPDLQDQNFVYGNLRWGVTGQAYNGIGHCSLAPSDRWGLGRVGPPVHGWAYAGLRERSRYKD